MKYLKLFETETDYNQFKDSEDYVLPNVIFSEETGVVYEAVKVMKTVFNRESYDDRKELYDLIFNKVLWDELSTPIYLYHPTYDETVTINYCMYTGASIEDFEYGDSVYISGIGQGGDPAYYRIEPENDYAIIWDD